MTSLLHHRLGHDPIAEHLATLLPSRRQEEGSIAHVARSYVGNGWRSSTTKLIYVAGAILLPIVVARRPRRPGHERSVEPGWGPPRHHLRRRDGAGVGGGDRHRARAPRRPHGLGLERGVEPGQGRSTCGVEPGRRRATSSNLGRFGQSGCGVANVQINGDPCPIRKGPHATLPHAEPAPSSFSS
jgi:hypothetical protein